MWRSLYYLCLLTFSIVITIFKSQSFALEKVQVNQSGVATTFYGEKVYRMDFAYSFPGKENVYLDNVGTISASGELNFFGMNKTLVFRDCRNCAVIKASSFRSEDIDLGKLDAPHEKLFSEARQHHEWVRPPEFTRCLFKILAEFGFEYVANQRDYFSIFRTVWFDLTNLPENLKGRVSFIFSSPSEPPPGIFFFKVGKVVIERRINTKRFRFAEDDHVIQASEDLQTKIIEKLKKLKGSIKK